MEPRGDSTILGAAAAFDPPVAQRGVLGQLPLGLCTGVQIADEVPLQRVQGGGIFAGKGLAAFGATSMLETIHGCMSFSVRGGRPPRPARVGRVGPELERTEGFLACSG